MTTSNDDRDNTSMEICSRTGEAHNWTHTDGFDFCLDCDRSRHCDH